MPDDPDSKSSNIILLRGPQSEGDSSDAFDKREPMWFMNPDYNPCPEYDIVTGEYRFRYRPEYENYFIARGLVGQSLVAISSELAIPFAIIRHWATKIPSFAVALDMSRQHCQTYWESVGQENLTRKSFNAVGWLRMMAVRFPDSWRDIEPEARVTPVADPYGFEEQEDQGEAIINAEAIYQKLLRLKDSG